MSPAESRSLQVRAGMQPCGGSLSEIRYADPGAEHRSALLLGHADRALRDAGCSVQEAAHLAGYATASGFIVAYKRRYGVCPGLVAHA